MLTDYINSAMERAHCEIIEGKTCFGEIDCREGIFANADTIEHCREKVHEILEGWIVLGHRLGHDVPVIDGIHLFPTQKWPDSEIDQTLGTYSKP